MGSNKIEPLNYARLHDGWAYWVTLKNGAPLRLHDHDNLEAISARLRYAKKDDTFVEFSGASDSVDAIKESGRTDQILGNDPITKPEGAGIIFAGDVTAICYLAPWDDEEDAADNDSGDNEADESEEQEEEKPEEDEEEEGFKFVKKEPVIAEPVIAEPDEDEDDAE